jgi:hypothetical protein
VLACAFAAQPARAAPCDTGNFEEWLEIFKREAAGRGISQRMLGMCCASSIAAI